MASIYTKESSSRLGFSLIEVVLAIGIFLVTVLALVGLLGPTLKSVDEVEKTDEIASVVNTVNAYLQSSTDIVPAGESKFEAIYEAVRIADHATMFVFREFYNEETGGTSADATDVRIQVGFGDNVDVEASAKVTDFTNVAGPIYRVVLSASSVTPVNTTPPLRSLNREQGVYRLTQLFAAYPEGYLALEVRIFAEDGGPNFTPGKNLEALADEKPLFTYNTAIVR